MLSFHTPPRGRMKGGQHVTRGLHFNLQYTSGWRYYSLIHMYSISKEKKDVTAETRVVYDLNTNMIFQTAPRLFDLHGHFLSQQEQKYHYYHQCTHLYR